MFKRINLQYLISYLGSCPFIIIIFDKFLLYQFEANLVQDFIIFYAMIIFVFIGSSNWNLKQNISNKLILYGFFPSLCSVFIILFHLCSYEVLNLLIFFFLIQLFFDKFIYKTNLERKIYFFVRLPLTLITVLSLIAIQL